MTCSFDQNYGINFSVSSGSVDVKQAFQRLNSPTSGSKTNTLLDFPTCSLSIVNWHTKFIPYPHDDNKFQQQFIPSLCHSLVVLFAHFLRSQKEIWVLFSYTTAFLDVPQHFQIYHRFINRNLRFEQKMCEKCKLITRLYGPLNRKTTFRG